MYHRTAYVDVLKAKFSWNNLIDTKLSINSFLPSFILIDCLELLKLHRLLCPTDLGFIEDTEMFHLFLMVELFFPCIKKVFSIQQLSVLENSNEYQRFESETDLVTLYLL